MITQVVKLSVKQSSGKNHKRTQQGASAKLESYLYCYMLICVLWDAWDMNNFYFLFLLFSDFIGILFSFSFLFFVDDEEARDIAVT